MPRSSIRARLRSRQLLRYVSDRRGNVAVLVALLIVPLIAVLGLGGEVSTWFLLQRAEQNAADSAVLAAANNGSSSYASEGASVATSYGYTEGVSNTHVTIIDSASCPTPPGGTCYQATITQVVPLYLVQVVGYSGTDALGTSRGQKIAASSMARLVDYPISDCILSLSTTGIGFRINGNGGANIDLNKCFIQSNSGAKCDGANADANAALYFVAGNDAGCDPGAPGNPSPIVSDPYTETYPRSNIPATGNPPTDSNCTGPTDARCYWQESNSYGTTGSGGGKKTVTIANNDAVGAARGNVVGGTISISGGNKTFFGDVKLTSNTTISGSGTVTIVNGKLDLNGYTLLGSGVTMLFTGATAGSNFNPSHSPPTNGTLDISAPDKNSTSVWHGVAIYQDPNLTSGVDWTSSGNALTFDVTGLIYMPHANILFSGTINKSSTGAQCYAIVDYTFQSNGTVTITEDQSQCPDAGLEPPESLLKRAVMVQ